MSQSAARRHPLAAALIWSIGTVATSAWGASATAQTPADINTCLNQSKSATPDAVRAACDAFIAAPSEARHLPWAHMARGQLAYQAGDHATAIADFTTAIDGGYPGYGEAYYFRGMSRYASGGDRKAVIDDLAATLTLAPARASRAHLYSGASWLELGIANYAAGIAEYEAALAAEPTLANDAATLKPLAMALTRRGNDRLAAKDARGAIEDYDRALAIDPKVATAAANRKIAADRKDAESALAAEAARKPVEAAAIACDAAIREADAKSAASASSAKDKTARSELLLWSLQQRADIIAKTCPTAPAYAARLSAWSALQTATLAACKTAAPTGACTARLPTDAASASASPSSQTDQGISINIPSN